MTLWTPDVPAAAPDSARLIHVARQAIYDRDLSVHGYELLFRASASAEAASLADEYATARVLINTFAEMGLATLVGSRTAFINVNRPFLTGELPLPFAPVGTALEILETVEVDEEVVAGAQRLVAEGHQIALDDIVWRPELQPLLELAAYVKVDISLTPYDLLPGLVERFSAHGAAVIAERVETAEDLEAVSRAGFAMYQGYLFQRPQTVTGSTVAPGHLACLRMLAKLSDPDVDVSVVESLLRTDAPLSLRVLRAANSAAYATRQIASVRQALVLIGLERLRSWLLLMVLSDASGASGERLETAITRARTCELVAGGGLADPDSAFLVGMLSGMQDVLGLATSTVTDQLSLTDEVSEALQFGAGNLGEVLRAVRSYETGDPAAFTSPRIDPFELSRAYLSAVAWSLQACESALGSG